MEQYDAPTYMTLHVSRKALEEAIKDTEEFLEDVLAALHFKRVVVSYFVPPLDPTVEDQYITVNIDRSKLAALQAFLTQKKD